MVDEQTKIPDFEKVMGDFDGGIFSQTCAKVLSEVAEAVVIHGDKGKKGKMTIELTFDRIEETSQVTIAHKLAYSAPTKRGKRGEERTTTTPMYVARGGRLSIAPEHQLGLFREEDK